MMCLTGKMAQLNRLFIIIQYAFKYVFVEL